MQALSESEELSIFETDLVMDLIDYKWETYARRQHLFGFLIHLCYVFTMMANVRLVYVNRTPYNYTDSRFKEIPLEIRVGLK